MAVLRGAVALSAVAGAAAGGVAQTPPMGWMSWGMFTCNEDCSDAAGGTAKNTTRCISEGLYYGMADALVADGYAAVGYDRIHIDDCWQSKNRTAEGDLTWDTTRFPSGMPAMGKYLHDKALKFGHYTSLSEHTCIGSVDPNKVYPGSRGHISQDAQKFAEWGVDYLKVDGCNFVDYLTYYPMAYPAMGDALLNTSRDIVYSCSWPAYIPYYGNKDESAKHAVYNSMVAHGCNVWRNYNDLYCNWAGLSDVIEHYGTWSTYLSQFAGPGHWNDMDQLLLGQSCLSDDEAKTQFAIWSIMASPLIMSNDLRTVKAQYPGHYAVLTNEEAIAVSQDALGVPGMRVSGNATTPNVWSRVVSGGLAVAVFNPTAASQTVDLDLAALGIDLNAGDLMVRDIWAKTDLGAFKVFNVTVPTHGTAFFKFTQ